MNNLIVKATSLALGAAFLAATATPAEAQRRYDRYDRYHHRDRTGAAVAAGVAGLAIGAALASRNRGYYYDDYGYDRPRYRSYRGYRGYDRGWDRGYYGYNRGYYNRGYGWRGDRGCYTRRVWDPYEGRRVRVRYCR